MQVGVLTTTTGLRLTFPPTRVTGGRTTPPGVGILLPAPVYVISSPPYSGTPSYTRNAYRVRPASRSIHSRNNATSCVYRNQPWNPG